jgi:hypothetical protein
MLRKPTIKLVSESMFSRKSLRNGTLLTVGFNLRKLNVTDTLQSPAVTAHSTSIKFRHCGTCILIWSGYVT